MQIKNGVDIVAIHRMEKAMERASFRERFFAPEECCYFAEKGNAPQTVAGHFAAKEAFSKALGSGISGFELREVVILHDEQGAPALHLTGKAAALSAGWQFSLSISHDGDYAIAFVTAMKE